ncbi:MAG TPA: hypothetical protein VFD04_26570, partial [Actinomycetes bacterium]|nr:hypothetical protein [Actinomycetes bacterium]
MRTRRGLAALAVTALAAASWAGARAPAAAARPFARPADTPLARPAALVLVGRLSLAEALDARPRGQAAMVAGFVSTLPEDQPDAARVLSLAAGRRVDLPAGGVAPGDPAAADRLRAANPDARFGGLPPLRVLAAPGAEAAGLLALGPSGPAPAAEPLPATGTLRLRPDRLLVVAVPGAAGLRDVLARIGGAPGADGVVVVGLRPAPGRARAAPFLGLGGRQAGLVTSASTRRTGLVAFEDLRPTLAGAGAGGDGTPIHLVADPGPAAATASVDRRVAALVLARTWAVPLLAVVACLALLALLPAARRGRAWTGPARALVALTLALPAGYLAASMAEPPAARVWRHASPPALGVAPDPGALAGWAAAWVGCGVAVALLLAAAALRLGRP